MDYQNILLEGLKSEVLAAVLLIAGIAAFMISIKG